ncbi:cell growth-regulating nucleolar protein [Sphaeramia orbicularis]|uniref:Cell growth-regulating nucleolar protein n=1 Tax=Sphaeramia orbicularis TaxID=375764 RepID=A0A672Z9A9_9TELE|nr:cell growth-regulating nucleolar protein [Sphaeramia orbicularis]
MVFFTCNACGESLKKAQVDKHVSGCRGCEVLSCIDCGKDFWGDDYKNHNKCISEDQKYGGKGYEAKANKGDVKQQQWIQKINEAMVKPGVSPNLKNVLKQVSTYDNVPRKKAKFQNWMKNSLKISNTHLHEEVWNILSADIEKASDAPQLSEDKPAAVEAQMVTNGNENGQPKAEKKKLNKRERKEARQQKHGKAVKGAAKAVVQEAEEEQVIKKKKKDRKRKHSCDEDGNEEQNGDFIKKAKTNDQTTEAEASEETEEQAVLKGKFNWKGNIKAVLRDSPDQELSVKKLRKKIVAAYYSFTGDGNFKTEDEVLALFNKKISKNPKFRVLKDRVKLVN